MVANSAQADLIGFAIEHCPNRAECSLPAIVRQNTASDRPPRLIAIQAGLADRYWQPRARSRSHHRARLPFNPSAAAPASPIAMRNTAPAFSTGPTS